MHHKCLRSMSKVILVRQVNRYNTCGIDHKQAQFIVSKIRECLLFSLASKFYGRITSAIMLRT